MAAVPGGSPEGARLLRDAALRRLLALDAAGSLTTEHVRVAAESLGVAERTVFRWLGRARSTGELGPAERPRFVVDEQLRQRLAYWRGNVSALHRELVAAARAGGPAAPSRTSAGEVVLREEAQRVDVLDLLHPPHVHLRRGIWMSGRVPSSRRATCLRPGASFSRTSRPPVCRSRGDGN